MPPEEAGLPSSGDLTVGWIDFHFYPPLLRLSPKSLPRFHLLYPTGKNNNINGGKGSGGIMSSDLRSHDGGRRNKRWWSESTTACTRWSGHWISFLHKFRRWHRLPINDLTVVAIIPKPSLGSGGTMAVEWSPKSYPPKRGRKTKKAHEPMLKIIKGPTLTKVQGKGVKKKEG
ncbi:hypothetical protein LWI28_028289 [Acer negundo]|uniref:Uncharacterized protein n=1 Tax=Acer negundo TaxID=4023 RepID=A0AAD5P6H5_ACENE|nr:hypothetical protein LWI28_028289 [Acer negundo]